MPKLDEVSKAVEEGIARNPMTYDEEFKNAEKIIRRARDITHNMMRDGFIPEAEE